ncbi:MAG: cation transporter [Chloroflexi bacterium]|nr:cation transporter [Chloroflexota bacterium]
MAEHHAHGHHQLGHAEAGSAAGRQYGRLRLVLTLTAVYMVAEVVASVLTGSLALLADAGHMVTDVLGLVMALLAIRFARRPATPSRTYGFYRAEILAALANGLLLCGVGAFIVFEAWERFQHSREIASTPMLIVALGGLAVNLFAARLLHSGAGESLNVRGAYLEVLSDLLGSLGVVIAAVAIGFTGWWQIDPIMSLLIGLFILPRTWQLLKGALDILLEATPAHVDVEALEAAMHRVPGVLTVHDLHVWTITSGFVAMSGHIRAEGRPSGAILHDLQAVVQERFGIEHVTLQIERPDHFDDGTCCVVDPRCLLWRANVEATRSETAPAPAAPTSEVLTSRER